MRSTEHEATSQESFHGDLRECGGQQNWHAPASSRVADQVTFVLSRVGGRLERGVTLVEILVVVAIMSLVAAGVGFAVIPKFKQAQIDTATNSMREIRNAAARWKAVRGGEDCPTVSTLVQDKEIDSASKTDDPWGSAYKITCLDDEIVILSPGPDKKEGSADDIAVPKSALTKR